MTIVEAVNDDVVDVPAVESPADVIVDTAVAGEKLVARRPLTWHGHHYEKGERLIPSPTGRKREVMSRAGFIVAEVDGLTDVVARVSAIVPDGLVCPQCARVLKTPKGMKVHTTRVHGG